VPAELFVDASAWYPLALHRHPSHAALAATLEIRVRRGVRIVTTNLVIAETHALLVKRVGPEPALAFARTVRRPPNRVETSTPELEERAMDRWLQRYRDQDFSLADAVSFTVMEERGISEALTLDRHFAVAGFQVVPLS
jgi:predicted nucleic acid-binding protein